MTLSHRGTLIAPAPQSSSASSSEMADRVSAAIVRRTSGQVRELRVHACEQRVVLTGRSRTYHVKQLAQEAALNEISGCSPLVNEIVVF